MKKSLLAFLFTGIASASFAQVTPPQGATQPATSTEAAPVWYAMMSSHITESDRQNRWMYYDGTTLATSQYADGLDGQDIDLTDYAWRLEADGDNVRLVHYDGLQVQVPANATAEDGSSNVNTRLTMGEDGAAWTLGLSADANAGSPCADNQYVLRYTDYAGERAFLNAMPGGETEYGITIYANGAHQASGWFFVPIRLEEDIESDLPGWDYVYTNTLSGTTQEMVDITGWTGFSSPGVREATAGGGVLEGMPWCYSLNWPWGYEYAYLTLEIAESGTYMFKCRGRIEGSGTLSVTLRCGDASIESQLDLPAVSTPYSLSQSDELPGKQMQSNEIELQPGTYKFCLMIGETVSNVTGSTNLFIGDFKLYKRNDAAFNRTVSWTEPQNGTLSVTSGGDAIENGTNVADGTELVIAATPDEGYSLEALTVNGEPFTSGDTYVVNDDVEISVTFAEEQKQSYTVSWEGDNCTISVTDTASGTEISNGDAVAEGTEVRITATPDEGYALESLTVNGEDFTSGDAITVNEDVAIIATVTGTGLHLMQDAGTYYDAAREMLCFQGLHRLQIFDITGHKIADTDANGNYDISMLDKGIYIAVIDGKVLKFRK